MQTQKILILAALSLLMVTLAASTAQAANAQTVPAAPNPNSHAPHCITCNTGPYTPPCWSNSAISGTCAECCTHLQPGPCWKQ